MIFVLGLEQRNHITGVKATLKGRLTETCVKEQEERTSG